MAVGSVPRPRWVQDVLAKRIAAQISEDEADAIL